MCDCRLCKNAHRIWNEYDCDEITYKIACIAKEVFIDPVYVTNGPCEDYVDVDSYDIEE